MARACELAVDPVYQGVPQQVSGDESGGNQRAGDQHAGE
jgi:hypothetical protein